MKGPIATIALLFISLVAAQGVTCGGPPSDCPGRLEASAGEVTVICQNGNCAGTRATLCEPSKYFCY